MAGYKPIDVSKEEFRKYLDRTGVLDAMTKVLIKCNADRPEHAVDYLINNLGDVVQTSDPVMSLKAELSNAHAEIERLKCEMNQLRICDGLTEPETDAKQGMEPETTPRTNEARASAEEAEASGIANGGAATNSVPSSTTEQGKEKESITLEKPANEVQTSTVSDKVEKGKNADEQN